MSLSGLKKKRKEGVIMAKRLIDWSEENGILTMSKYMGADVPNEKLADFELEKLFPGFSGFTEVQKFIIVYGVKQKLSDHNNTEKDLELRAKSVKEKFQDFVDGKLVGTRANGTGATAAKKQVAEFKKASEVVSLEGLNLKKMFFPDTFTKEDQEKLNEFLMIAAKHISDQQRAKKK